VVVRFGIKVGAFVPKNYVQQLVENSDFRKYDDGLRMILDCTEALASALTERLAKAAGNGVVRYGLHRQDAAMMT
jgi:phosphomannomutase